MWNIYRHNGEWVGRVEAQTQEEALVLAWAKYFGMPLEAAKGRVRNDGTLRVVKG